MEMNKLKAFCAILCMYLCIILKLSDTFSQKLDIKRGQEPVASIRKINALPGQQLNYLPTRKTKKFLLKTAS